MSRRRSDGSISALRFGWHDSYTYSKALAELAAVRAAEEFGMPMLILRPTIVESAIREPAPCVSRPSSLDPGP